MISQDISSILNNKTIDLKIDEKEQLSYTILPTDATDKSVAWFTSHPLIASVSQTGLVTALAEGTSWIVVRANNGLFADTCQVNVTKPNGVNDNPTLSDIGIYPNPVSDYLTINTNQEIGNIEIFSALGIKVLETNWKEKIDVSGLLPGVYFVRISYRFEKFVKM